jgi:cytochrome c biogenesis protein CcdA/thiol-disulfide isomerase/thioredoxin
VLPVLPALFSASATGGRRRPLGIVLGLAITFTVTIVGLATVVDGVGLGDGATRSIAIVVLLVFGLSIAMPAVAARLEAPLSRLARFGPKSVGRGFWSGVLVGAALGFVYAPCAGPILAAVVSVGAASAHTVAVALGYAAGSAAVLLVLALAGRALIARVPRGPAVQRVLGGVLVVTAVLMAFQLDVRFQSAIANHLPAAVVNPTKSLEDSHAVGSRLTTLRPESRFARAAHAKPKSGLPDYGEAPEFTGITHWLNSKPLTLASLRGRVVLIDFWTYTCINCIRTLPHLTAWDRTYRKDGLEIVGVHSPEFSFEKDTPNVKRAIAQDGIRYPVAQDNDLATWGAWSNEYWPAEYLIDARGHVRHVNFGEGKYDETEQAIRSLLEEAGAAKLGAGARPDRTYDPAAETTPETYLGTERAERFLPAPSRPGTSTYRTYGGQLPDSHFSFGGTWKVTPESATAIGDSTLTGRVVGKDVYLVLGGRGKVQVLIDGKPSKTVNVTSQKLYHLFSAPQVEKHTMTLKFAPGISGYAFTFG